MKRVLILKDFAQFKKGQRVEVDNSYTPTSEKVVNRYVESGRAKWDEEPKKPKPTEKRGKSHADTDE